MFAFSDLFSISHTRSRQSRKPGLMVLGLTLLTAFALAAPLWGEDELTLRINDVKGVAGGLVAIEVRTYAPRGVGQGQICLFAASRLSNSGSGSFAGPSDEGLQAWATRAETWDLIEATAATASPESTVRNAIGAADSFHDATDQPLLTLEGAVVLSSLGDAVSRSFFDAGSQMAMVDFRSDSGTINETDGPMLVLYFRLAEDLVPDQEFEIGLDRAHTFIVDEKGEEVPLELKGGRLRVEEPDCDCRSDY